MRALHQAHGYPIREACALLDLAPSSYYYRSAPVDERELVAAIKTVAGQYVRYGTRRMTAQLRRSPYHYRINRKRVQRLMRQLGLLRRRKRSAVRTTNSRHAYARFPNLVKDLVVNHPDQVWVSDITYIHLGSGWVYLAIVLDVFTRAVRGWQVSSSLDMALSLGALQRALQHGTPAIHHSDQGIHYAYRPYVQLLHDHQVHVSMAAVGAAYENGYAERFMRTLKDEEVSLSDYRDLADVQQQLGHFIHDVYHTKRIHSALGYLTPAEFEANWRHSTLDERHP